MYLPSIHYSFSFAQTKSLFSQNAIPSPDAYLLIFQIMTNLSSPPEARNLPEKLHRTQFTQAKETIH